MKWEELGIFAVVLAVLAGGFWFLYSIIQNENAETQAQLNAIENQSNNGSGGILGGILSIFGI